MQPSSGVKREMAVRRSEATFRNALFLKAAQGSRRPSERLFFAASLLVRFFMQVKK